MTNPICNENSRPADFPSIRESIPKEELSKFPSEKYQGRIFVIQSKSEAQKACDYLCDIAGKDVIGFDTETRPSFKKGHTYSISLVQLCTKDSCFLFRTMDKSMWNYIKPILEDERTMKIGLSLKDDFNGVKKATKGEIVINPKNFVELQSYVKSFGIKDCGLSRIYANLFEKKISKKMRLSNWEEPFLSDAQKEYAALDAYATRRIYVELENRKKISSSSTDNVQNAPNEGNSII
jgi:ribonuclease D